MMVDFLPIAVVVVGVVALFAGVWWIFSRKDNDENKSERMTNAQARPFDNRSAATTSEGRVCSRADAEFKAEIFAEIDAKFRSRAISPALFESLVGRVRELEAKYAALQDSALPRVNVARADLPPARSASPTPADEGPLWLMHMPSQRRHDGAGSPPPAGMPRHPAIVDQLLAAHQALTSQPDFVSRDRFVAQFDLRNLDADLVESAHDEIYWLYQPAAGSAALLLPGWSVIKDWHTVYRGQERGLARQTLMRCFDIAEGNVLRVVMPATLSVSAPWSVAALGRIEGA